MSRYTDVEGPKASICIPAYQAARHLRATIDSVLAQNYCDLEILFIDNNSTDGTREILETIKDDRVRIIRNATTLSIYDNWNRAVRESRGVFVKLVCADDLLEPDCIAAQVAVLEENPDVKLVSGRTDFIDDEGELLRPARGISGIVGRQPGERVVRQTVRSGSNPVGPTAAAMYRRKDFNRCGGYIRYSLFPNVSDVDLWVRLIRDGDFFGMARTVASFRIGSGSVTATTSTRSLLDQYIRFSRHLVEDPYWNIPRTDRIVGRVNGYDKQLRRTVLYGMSNYRAWKRRRWAIEVSSAGDRRDKFIARTG